MLILSSSIFDFNNPVSNLRFTNLTPEALPADFLSTAGLGHNFAPSLDPTVTAAALPTAWKRFSRSLRLREYFFWNDPGDDGKPMWAHVPNPRFEPTAVKGRSAWHPQFCSDPSDYPLFRISSGLADYLAAAAEAVSQRLSPAAVRAHLSRASSANIRSVGRRVLRSFSQPDNPLVLVKTDKGLQPVLDYKSRYLQMARSELQETHEPASAYFHRLAPLDPGDITLPDWSGVDTDRDQKFVLEFVMAAMKNSLLPLLKATNTVFPWWLTRYLEASLRRHPKTFADYAVPFFYVLYKIHKLSASDLVLLRRDTSRALGVRPVTANFCWCTQPLALFVAKFLQPYVEKLPEFTKDSTHINRLFSKIKVAGGDLLLSIDVARLYPSIPLAFCINLVRRFLARHGMDVSLIDLISRCLSLILTTNFCQFLGRIHHQILGFATGVACGAEVANIYLHELLRELFMAYSAYILVYRRFIDDLVLVWKGPRAAAEEFLYKLNTDFRQYNFQITWEISGDSTVFLDLKLFKGAGWLRSSLLDTATFAKAINAYLYIPFKSCVPRSVLSGLIATELRRHLLRCTGATDYYENLYAFYLRLRARGYPASFLQTQFERAPSFDRRRHLLFSESTTPTAVSGPSVLALPYSHEVDKLLRGTLRDTAGLLPDYLASHRRLIAWYKAPKICDLASVPGKKAFDQRFLTTQPAAAAPGLDVP